MNCPPKCKTFLYIFRAKNRGQKIDLFEILSEVLIRLKSSWCKALTKAHCLLYLIWVECIWLGKISKKPPCGYFWPLLCVYILFSRTFECSQVLGKSNHVGDLENSIMWTDKNLKLPFGGSIALMSTTNLPSFNLHTHRLHELPTKMQNISLHFSSQK